MAGRVLITGGLGFIGRHLAELLLSEGFGVVLLDSLEPQVHTQGSPPTLPGAEIIIGDIRDRRVLYQALAGVDSIVHLAAQVGVGQSMYEIERYVAANVVGTAVLLEAVLERRERPRRLVVASSMSVYGEGAYRCETCGPRTVEVRDGADLARGAWEPRCNGCGAALEPVPTPEGHRLRPASVYAVTKRDQEELSIGVGRAYDLPVVALRFFNVYGPGQSIRNPYTGVAAIFAARLLAGEPPLVFEDGKQMRDFVHVKDVVRACYAALTTEVRDVVLNVGTGIPHTVLDVAHALQAALGGPDPQLLSSYRPGDVRHCFADINAVKKTLDWTPRVAFEEGLRELAEWLRGQPGDSLGQLRALTELQVRGLVRGRS